MRKTTFQLLLIVLVALVIASCKKDNKAPGGNDNKSYYIKLKLNGVQKQYTYNATSLLAKPSVYACSIMGLFSSSNTAGVTIGLTDGEPFAINKTYTGQVIVANGVTTIQGTFTYKEENGTNYFASGTTANTSLTLKFTEIAPDHLKGTFSGTLLKVGSAPLSYATFTEGEFYVGRSL